MIVITSRTAGLRVQLLCEVCRQRLTLASCWLAFPTDGERVEGKWIHRDCINGRVEAVFGVATITLLRGTDAFVHLAQNISDV